MERLERRSSDSVVLRICEARGKIGEEEKDDDDDGSGG